MNEQTPATVYFPGAKPRIVTGFSILNNGVLKVYVEPLPEDGKPTQQLGHNVEYYSPTAWARVQTSERPTPPPFTR